MTVETIALSPSKIKSPAPPGCARKLKFLRNRITWKTSSNVFSTLSVTA